MGPLHWPSSSNHHDLLIPSLGPRRVHLTLYLLIMISPMGQFSTYLPQGEEKKKKPELLVKEETFRIAHVHTHFCCHCVWPVLELGPALGDVVMNQANLSISVTKLQTCHIFQDGCCYRSIPSLPLHTGFGRLSRPDFS